MAASVGVVQVTVMKEVEEEWPVAKETSKDVWTSTVSLEPRTAEVPEIAMEDVEVEVRTLAWCNFLQNTCNTHTQCRLHVQ